MSAVVRVVVGEVLGAVVMVAVVGVPLVPGVLVVVQGEVAVLVYVP